MSRIGKAPIPLPDKVSVSLNGLAVTVKGPKGELSRTLPDGVQISQDGNTLVVSPSSETRRSRERHGLCRTLVANMVEGVSTGYRKELEINGVGYRAAKAGSKLTLALGYSHPIEIKAEPRMRCRSATTQATTRNAAPKAWIADATVCRAAAGRKKDAASTTLTTAIPCRIVRSSQGTTVENGKKLRKAMRENMPCRIRR